MYKLICKVALNRFILFVESDRFNNVYMRLSTLKGRTIMSTPILNVESLEVLYYEYTNQTLLNSVREIVNQTLNRNKML